MLHWEGPCLPLTVDIIPTTYSRLGQGTTMRTTRTVLREGNEQLEAIIPPPFPLQTPGMVVTPRETASSWGLKMKPLSEELPSSSISVAPGAAHP